MVWRCPGISCKVDVAVVFLYVSRMFEHLNNVLCSALTCNILAMRSRVRANISFTSRETVDADGM